MFSPSKDLSTSMSGIKESTIKILLASTGPTSDSDFVFDVLNNMRNDITGEKCREDWVILEVGYRKYLDKKHDRSKKDHEIVKNIRSEMRLLARLAIEFNRLTSLKTEDMFIRKNYEFLEKAINNIIENTSEDQSTSKYGLKLSIGWMIKRAIGILEGVYSIKEQDSMVHELDCLRKVLHLRWPGLFAGAQFRSFQRRNEDLRLPSALLNPADIDKLTTFNEQSIFQQSQLIHETWLDRQEMETLGRKKLYVCFR